MLPGAPTLVVIRGGGLLGAHVAVAVRVALTDVIDPDLGVYVVDLGFVRAVVVSDRTAVITMTLRSAACPLSGIIENQIRSRLAGLDGIDDFRVVWQWRPARRSADITGAAGNN